MNPIDQLMQSFGSTPSAALAGLMGTGQATGTEQGSLAAQFAQALQTIEAASTVPGAPAPEVPDLTVDQAELLASLQMTMTPDAAPSAPFAGLAQAIQAGDATTAANPALFAKNSVSGFAIQAALASSDSTPALTASSDVTPQQPRQNIPILPQAALEKLGLNLEQLPALPSSEELAAVSQAGVSNNSHILPVDAAQGLFGAAVEQTPVLTLAVDGAAVELTPQAAVPTGEVGRDVPEAALTAPQGKPLAEAPALPAAPLTNQPVQALASQPAPELMPQVAAPQQASPAPASPEAQANDAEANGVVTQQAQQQVAAVAPKANGTERTPQAGHKSATAGKEALDLKASAAPAAETLKDAASAKPVEPVAPLPATQAPPPAREAQPPLTPERVSGFLDGTSASAVAAGLRGLKGDTGFMASMSLLGGKPTPELAHQVSQQLNMHVTKAFKDGQQEFTVRLDPAELGRVRVKLSFIEGGRVHAQVMAERPETLDLMQRDTRGLEKAIEAAGHKADGGIQFSLDTNDQESAGRAFAEAVQQEKMRDDLAARSGVGHQGPSAGGDDILEETVPLETILANVSVETGLDIEV